MICYSCHLPFIINRAVNIEAMRTKGPPRPGDILICQGCFTVNIVVKIREKENMPSVYTGILRAPTLTEKRLIDANSEVQAVIAAMKANQGTTGMQPII